MRKWLTTQIIESAIIGLFLATMAVLLSAS